MRCYKDDFQGSNENIPKNRKSLLLQKNLNMIFPTKREQTLFSRVNENLKHFRLVILPAEHRSMLKAHLVGFFSVLHSLSWGKD